jgi:hypothetical protein
MRTAVTKNSDKSPTAPEQDLSALPVRSEFAESGGLVANLEENVDDNGDDPMEGSRSHSPFV